MNKLKLSSILLTLTTFGWSQNVIHVRGQHSKKQIYTLKEGEYISRGEAKIFVKAQNGPDYEFIIQSQSSDYCCDFKYKLFQNSKLVSTSTYPHFSDDDSWYSTDTVKGVKMYKLHFKNGKTFGPYQSCYPVYDAAAKKNVGVWYRKDNRESVYFFNGKTIGPFKGLNLLRTEGKMNDYTYESEQGKFLFTDGKTYGPYRDVRVRELASPSNKGLVYYFEQTENRWRVVIAGEEVPLVFYSSPNFHYDNDGKWVLEGTTVDGTKRSYYKQDQIEYCYDDYCRTYSNMHGDRINVSSIDGKSIYSNPVEVAQKGQKIGVFNVRTIYTNLPINSSFFGCILRKNAGNPNEEAYLLNQNELIGPLDNLAGDKVTVVGDDYFYIRERDSALMINGKESGHKRVVFFDYNNYPKSFYLCKKVGLYDVFYKNDKKISNAQIRDAGFNPDWYNLAENDYILEFKNDKFYAIPKGSTKRFGPVMRYSTILFSRGNAHYAECDERRMEVFIDGKLVSKGFCLTYDAQNNCYYWMSLADDKKMYLHTYQIG